MEGCFTWILALVAALFLMVTLIRWFEQVGQAIHHRLFGRIVLLMLFPPAAWFYPSRVSAGRPSSVPRHEPVRGFGIGPVMPSDAPPPGTPREFLDLPKVPPKKPARAAADPEKIARLRQKMREQGMLDEE